MRPDYTSASSSPDLKYSKGITRRKVKAGRDYRESLVKKAIKAKVARRDGYCRLEKATAVVGDCMGRSTWQHYRRRSETRGMPPEERHNTAMSGMNCQRHHDLIDTNVIEFEYLTDKGADGRMAFVVGGLRWEELEDPRR